MKRPATGSFLVVSVFALMVPGVGAQSLPLTDNAQAPYMGDYEGCAALGIKGNGLSTAWLNRTNIWGVDFPPSGQGSTWDHISGQWQDWFYRPWSRVLGVDGKPALFPKAAALYRQLLSLPGKSAANSP